MTIQESHLCLQQNMATLLSQFSEGMTTLLRQKGLDEHDRKNFEQTVQLVETVAKRFLENGQQAVELENRNHLFKLTHLNGTVALLLAAKEKQFHLALEEYTQLREAAEFLKQNLAQLPHHQGEFLTFDRKEICLKSTHLHFRGREDLLASIQHVLLKQQSVVLYGPPGIGKSETAIAFANRELEKKTYSLIWTIDSATKEQREQSTRDLADALGLPILKEDTAEAIQKRVYHRLEQLNQKWLLIFDNLDQQVGLPQRGGDIIITTIFQEAFPLYSHLEVLPFSENESLVLLKEITQEAESPDMYLLVKLLGGYPLVLGQVACYIHLTPGMTIASYMKEKNFSDGRALKPSDRYQRTLHQVLPDIAKHLSPLAQDWLGICAYFNPDKISKSLIIIWLETFHQEIHDFKKEAEEIFVSLVNRGFLRFQTKAQTLSMHRVFQDFFKKESFYLQTLQLTLKMLETSKLKQDEILKEELSLTDEWIQHALFLAENIKFKTIDKQVQSVFLTFIGHRDRHEFNYLQAIKNYQLAWEVENSIELNNDSLRLADIYQGLGICWREQEDLEKAIKYHELALKIREHHFGQDHRDVAHSISHLGLCFLMQNNDAKAMENHTKALNIRESLFGQDHADVARSLSNQGLCFRHQKKTKEALDHLEKALKIQTIILGPTHPDVARSLSNIALIFDSQQDYSQAMVKYESTLKIQEVAFGSYHPEYVNTLRSMGCCLLKQEKFDESLAKFKQALPIIENIYGLNHSFAKHTLLCISQNFAEQGNSLVDQKKYQESLEKYQQAIDTIANLNTLPNNFECVFNNMGVCLEAQGKYPEALEKYKQALAIKDHPQYRKNLNNCLFKQKNTCLTS